MRIWNVSTLFRQKMILKSSIVAARINRSQPTCCMHSVTIGQVAQTWVIGNSWNRSTAGSITNKTIPNWNFEKSVHSHFVLLPTNNDISINIRKRSTKSNRLIEIGKLKCALEQAHNLGQAWQSLSHSQFRWSIWFLVNGCLTVCRSVRWYVRSFVWHRANRLISARCHAQTVNR